ncbi:hypothetical protein Pint_02962 [Pistacia integerrima]|uniref:Uncharacterized protein n=1 Tax=Pistacia integerrima TaxID=434235 RepID=A0ACC0ZM39_9ROSI|nr:hypothetical protein Pint_02962 [Pistacia integerrima]
MPSIQVELFQNPKFNIKHILDLLRHSLLLPLPSRNEERSGYETFPIATKINESGIKFQANELAENILDIKFDQFIFLKFHHCSFKAKIIPRNLISLEQCCPNYPPIVTSYAKLMDNLTDTEKDVEILCDDSILHNWLNLEDNTLR